MSWAAAGLWTFVAGAVAVPAALFVFARRRVGLRLERARWVVAAVVAVRAALIPAGYPMEIHALLLTLAAVLVIFTQQFHRADRIWLVRASRDEAHGQIVGACRRLFLECHTDVPDQYALISRDGGVGEIRVRRLATGHLLLMIRGGRQGKSRLLLNWLGKQYPGPWPRPHIILKRSDA